MYHYALSWRMERWRDWGGGGGGRGRYLYLLACPIASRPFWEVGYTSQPIHQLFYCFMGFPVTSTEPDFSHMPSFFLIKSCMSHVCIGINHAFSHVCIGINHAFSHVCITTHIPQVPQFQPESAFAMFERFIKNEPF